MEKKFLYLSEHDVNKIINNNFEFVINTVEEALRMLNRGTVIQPDKISQIIDEKYQNRINCMPSTLSEIDTCGTKWVSVFPSNYRLNLSNVEGFTILSETISGGVKCFMNATETTSLRTAAVGAIAAKYLARSDSKSVGFIGAGTEARMHFKMLKHVCPQITKCYVSSRTDGRINSFIDEFQQEYPDVTFIHCHDNYRSAIVDSDIIVTAISSQAQVLKEDWIRPGMLYIHVAGLEDEYGVVKKADKIICDDWECVKHRTQTITQMYKKGLISDEDIYGNIGEIISKSKVGRENKNEFIYFNSVGLSVEDVFLANRIYEEAVKSNVGIWISK